MLGFGIWQLDQTFEVFSNRIFFKTAVLDIILPHLRFFCAADSLSPTSAGMYISESS
jgi:hypothetical protein